jgi:transcriptional regulator with XRE-family HTH domain
MMDFLTNLDLLLKSNNMKRADLARAIHVAPSTINSWYARGSEKVNINVLKEIAAYFNISLECLINGNNFTSLSFTEEDYTKQELDLIANFGKMLKESRVNNDK